MNFVQFVEEFELMEHAMEPIREEVLYKVDDEQVSIDLAELREAIESVFGLSGG